MQTIPTKSVLLKKSYFGGRDASAAETVCREGRSSPDAGLSASSLSPPTSRAAPPGTFSPE